MFKRFCQWRASRGLIGEHSLERDILVTGCGSSGTTYIAKLLNENAVAVTHDEYLGRDGVVTNACDGKEVWIYSYGKHNVQAYPMLKLPVQEFKRVVHVVRDPLKVIGSVTTKWKDWGQVWPHVLAGVPDLDDKDPCSLANAMRYWLHWNNSIEQLTDTRLRVEDVNKEPGLILDAVGRPLEKVRVPERVGQSGASRYPTWDELADVDSTLAQQVESLASRYGYVYV